MALEPPSPSLDQRDRIARLLAELDEELGPVDPQVMDEVRREWPDPAQAAADREDATPGARRTRTPAA